MPKQIETIVFGGGCFWCTETIFNRIKGVTGVVSGYAGGSMKNPSYYDVSGGNTGHAEVVKVHFDPTIISFEQLVDVFFHTHNPTTLNKQGADTGTEYRSLILYTTAEQKKTIERIRDELQKSEFTEPLVTEIDKLDEFYDAESYHQKFFEKNADGMYCQLVITPKLKYLEKKYKDILK
jgi:peptide-methionine (S)-S-oxide reductase